MAKTGVRPAAKRRVVRRDTLLMLQGERLIGGVKLGKGGFATAYVNERRLADQAQARALLGRHDPVGPAAPLGATGLKM